MRTYITYVCVHFLYVLEERRETLLVLFVSVLPFVTSTLIKKHTKKRLKFNVVRRVGVVKKFIHCWMLDKYMHTYIIHTNTRTSYSRIKITNSNARGSAYITNIIQLGWENETDGNTTVYVANKVINRRVGNYLGNRRKKKENQV